MVVSYKPFIGFLLSSFSFQNHISYIKIIVPLIYIYIYICLMYSLPFKFDQHTSESKYQNLRSVISLSVRHGIMLKTLGRKVLGWIVFNKIFELFFTYNFVLEIFLIIMSLCLRNQIFTSSSSSSSSSSSILIIIIIFLLLPTSTINFSDVQRQIEKLLRIRETPQSHSQSHNHYDIFFFLMWFSLFFFFLFCFVLFFFFFFRERAWNY